MKILCPISVGELLDKISILIVKKDKFQDKRKRDECEKELLILAPLVNGELSKELEQLVLINRKLYDAREKQFNLIENTAADNEVTNYLPIINEIHSLNKNRYKIRSELNKKYESEFIDQKSF